MKKTMIVMTLLALTACTTATKIAGGPADAGPKYLIECNNAWQSITDCHLRANELCPAGYEVLNLQTQGSLRNISVECKG